MYVKTRRTNFIPPCKFSTIIHNNIENNTTPKKFHTQYRDVDLFNHFQLGPQQFKYITFLRDSSDVFMHNILEFGEDDLLSWEHDWMLFITCCWKDQIGWFHLESLWSNFKASTAAMLAATTQVLVVFILFFTSKTWKNYEWKYTWNKERDIKTLKMVVIFFFNE